MHPFAFQLVLNFKRLFLEKKKQSNLVMEVIANEPVLYYIYYHCKDCRVRLRSVFLIILVLEIGRCQQITDGHNG